MTEETFQDATVGQDVPADTAAAPDTGAAPDEAPAVAERPVRAPRRRAPKQDPLLVADVAAARAGVEQIAEPSMIGPGHRVVVEEDRLVVHLFECTLPGYRGWNWFASLARAPRSRAVTVCEVGLLPGADALLAPEWVPWSERVSPEEKAQEEAAGTVGAPDDAGGPAAADSAEGGSGREESVEDGPGESAEGAEEEPRGGEQS